MEVRLVDEMQFLCFHSHAETLRTKSGAPWVEQDGREYWEQETWNAKITQQTFRTTNTVKKVMSGCKVDSNICLLCGYEGYTYDGCNYISLMEDLRTWTEAQITWLEMEQAGNAETQGLPG
ncbi:H-2 class I histocompatibility antigen, K-B alpha chain-like [Peromyscus leucopus]|uniref:H-2 class I histocompatibility antigen, K-B alpha chain-like n=1 Tax=Peromyscus leucopus TaxID=10041 RepID=UPI00188525B8|nr:H-2 class I histocompatibility antigen, K-B alpha chain-like [Peromyscus leucopus]